VSTRRERWLAFRAHYDTSPPLDDSHFRKLVETIQSEPDPVLQRSFVVHLGRIVREVVSDRQLLELGAMFTGKVPAYITNALIVRRLRRDPRDQQAIRDALASDCAFVHDVLATCELTPEQRAALTSRERVRSAR
jgi:hypothetical protein